MINKLTQESFQILTTKDVYLAKNRAVAFSKSMGFDKSDCSIIGLGVMEITQNILDHANSGTISINALNKNRILRVELKDNGEGIADIDKIFEDGYSSDKNSLGIGMGVARRSFDQCSVKSNPNHGTHVILEKYLPLDKEIYKYGSVSIKDERYLVNGDKIITKEYDGDTLLICVIDGAGQGESAAQISECITSVISQNYRDELNKIIFDADEALNVSGYDGGAAITLIRVTTDFILFLGIGDTHTYISQDGRLSPISNIYGRIGIENLPSLNVKRIPYSNKFSIISCTDGIKTDVDKYIMAPHISARNNAAHIFNTYHRPYGDASVFILNYKKHAER